MRQTRLEQSAREVSQPPKERCKDNKLGSSVRNLQGEHYEMQCLWDSGDSDIVSIDQRSDHASTDDRDGERSFRVHGWTHRDARRKLHR